MQLKRHHYILKESVRPPEMKRKKLSYRVLLFRLTATELQAKGPWVNSWLEVYGPCSKFRPKRSLSWIKFSWFFQILLKHFGSCLSICHIAVLTDICRRNYWFPELYPSLSILKHIKFRQLDKFTSSDKRVWDTCSSPSVRPQSVRAQSLVRICLFSTFFFYLQLQLKFIPLSFIATNTTCVRLNEHPQVFFT
jgi:hypothetical protein